MSTELGRSTSPTTGAAVFLTRACGTGDYSEATAKAIDDEVKRIISNQYRVALDILKDNREALEKGAKILLEKEKMEGDEIARLLDAKGPAQARP
jgi:cell division protease FtsH